MLIRLVFALLVLAGVILVLRWFSRTPPAVVKRRLFQALIGAGILALILLAATGRLHWLFALGASLVPVVRKLLPLLRYVPMFRGLAAQWKSARSAQGPSPGNRSQVESAYLRMTLDHDSGEMDGVVLKGSLQGSRLRDLSLEQLQQLWETCRREDADGAALLEAYLDRIHPDWRQEEPASDATSHTPGPMSREEAWQVLGLEPGADEKAIIEAHRRLMQKLHPDRGGSTYLAAKLNQAKDLLLGH